MRKVFEMTGEQILGITALALLGPLTAAFWYLDKRRSERKKQRSAEQVENA